MRENGIRSTEFWLTLAAIVVAGGVAVVLMLRGLANTGEVAAVIGAVLSTVLGAVGYTRERTKTKIQPTPTPPPARKTTEESPVIVSSENITEEE